MASAEVAVPIPPEEQEMGVEADVNGVIEEEEMEYEETQEVSQEQESTSTSSTPEESQSGKESQQSQEDSGHSGHSAGSQSQEEPQEVEMAEDQDESQEGQTVSEVPTPRKPGNPGNPKFQYENGERDDGEKNKENVYKERRLEFLLQKSEYFAHCLSSGDAVASTTEGEGTSKKRGRKPAVPSTGGNRHRKTEQEEDEELLEMEVSEKKPAPGTKSVITFLESPPFIKNGTMRDYQVRGLNWMINLYENNINGILADEMGLGKTLQTISLIGYLKHVKHVRSTYLVIVPKSTLSNWGAEFAKWCPTIRTVCLIGDAETRKSIIKNRLTNLSTWDVLITSYEMILKEKSVLKQIKWEYIIIDEAHRIKNENSKLSEFVREFKSSNRLLITGTPLQNNLHELWALLNFLLPDVFDSSDSFDNWFDTTSCLGDMTIVQRLHSVLRPFLLRRIKSEVEKNLPPKKEFKIYVPLTKMQRQWYKKVLMKDFDIINGAGKVERMRLANVLMQLRKVSNHPYLFEGAEPGPPYTTDLHLVTNSGKLLILDKLLPKLKSEGSRVLIFSQMTRMMDIMEDYFFWRKTKYYRLDGNTAHEDRQRMIDEYNSPGSETFVFMLSTRAGGLGINLATADVVIIYDSDWNPQVDLQAMDRAHRIGQTKEVRVFRLVTEHTVEEKIVERAAVKLKLDKLVIQQGRLMDATTQVKKEDMLSWIRFGANLVLSDTGEEIPDDTIEAILEKSKSKSGEIDSKLESLGESNLRNFAIESNSSVYNFEGENYRDKQKPKPLVAPEQWIEPPKRERKAAIYAEQMMSKPEPDEDWRPRAPRPPKLPVLHDFHFFPQRLHDLIQKEIHFYQQSIGYKVPKDPTIADDAKKAAKTQRDEQRKIDSAKPLTEDELEEREELLQDGYVNWTRKEFNQLIKLLERHGRGNITQVVAEFIGKEPDEIMEYYNVFCERFAELKNNEKILAQIEKGEERIKKKELVRECLAERISKCRAPLLQLQMPAAAKQAKSSYFTVQNDRFIIYTLYKIGLDRLDDPRTFDGIKKAILESNEFRFDWFLKSRSPYEIQKRCSTLLSAFEREIAASIDLAEHNLKQQKLERAKQKERAAADALSFSTPRMNGRGGEKENASMSSASTSAGKKGKSKRARISLN